VRHICRQVGISFKKLYEIIYADEAVSYGSGSDVEKESFPFVDDHFVQGKEPFIMRIEHLHKKLELEAEYPWMVKEISRHTECVIIVGMICREAVKFRILFQHLQVPFVKPLCDPLFVGII